MNTARASDRIVWLGRVVPGITLCLAVALVADRLGPLEIALTGRLYIDPVIIAILLGTSIRLAWRPGPAWERGVTYSAKLLLESSVVLLGASIDAPAVSKLGTLLILSVACVVTMAVVSSYLLGRACGLPRRLSVLVACGNAICGNAAIGAVAPLIEASAREITAAVSFTAVLGLLVVLALPSLIPVLHLTPTQYGELAGLTVYSVPQVLAATLPVGLFSSQIATMIKLMRVLMLCPLILVIAFVMAGRHRQSDRQERLRSLGRSDLRTRTPLATLFPWFLLGFIGLALSRSLGFIPTTTLGPIASLAHILTVVSMAALGLNVDLRTLMQCGNRIALAVAGSLAGIILMGLIVVRTLPVP